MKLLGRLLISAIAISLLNSTTLWAAGEEMEEVTPSFQNAAQLERALNLTSSSFTNEDMQYAKDQAEIAATGQIDALAKEHADSVVDQLSSDYADSEVHRIADEYATGLGYTKDDPSTGDLYTEAYDKAVARATAEGDWENAWETAYNKAYARATGGGDKWEDAWTTAYKYAIERATNEDFSNAYQAAYKKALEEEVASITGKTLQDIHDMRYIEKLGWGVIAKQRLQLHPSHNGRGNKWKHLTPPSIDDVNIPSGPTNPEVFPLEEEIAEATQRNVRTGWSEDQEFQARDDKIKGPKKKYGLAQTSGLATDDVLGEINASSGKDKNKSNQGRSGKSEVTSSSIETGASAKSKNDKDNGNKGSNGNKGGNKNNDNRNDNNGNKGDNNGNKGGNGKNK